MIEEHRHTDDDGMNVYGDDAGFDEHHEEEIDHEEGQHHEEQEHHEEELHDDGTSEMGPACVNILSLPLQPRN